MSVLIAAPVVAGEIFRYRMLRKNGQQQVEVVVWFTCPNCGKRHHVREIASTPFGFKAPFYGNFPCGNFVVLMPWELVQRKVKRTRSPKPAKILVAQVEK